ncbi:MAG: carboxypeptidase regulatory-like domain-containing protein [Fluviicola sp.]|nr:carboxypeptidase regulatory-like domain-containing protein [Fluviicola sp.]
MRIALVLLTIILSFSFCKKKGKADFTVTGKITNATYGIPLSGASIKIYEKSPSSSQEILVGTTTTDSGGNYSFTFPRNKVQSYRVNGVKANYFTFDETINFSDLSIDSDNIRNYSTTAKSWVKLSFVNTLPSAVTDEIRFSRSAGKSNCAECCTSGEISIFGIADTSIYCINDGNTNYTYNYNVVGTSNVGQQSVVTVAFDTTEILLNY